MEPTTSIEDLPNDVLVEILLHLGLNDLVHSARHVCSRWKEASEDVILWRNRVYSPVREDTDVSISIVLEQTPKLRSLAMNERGVGSVVLKAIVKHCPHLRKLKFFPHQRLSATFLKNLAVKCPSIESMNIPSLESSHVSKMKAIGHFCNLKEISFEEWPEKKVLLKPIADGCPHLRKINVRRKMLLYDDFVYFIAKKKDQLESLDISWISSDWKCLVIPLTNCTRLRRLVIVDYYHTNLEASFNALSNLHFLTSLTLDNFRDADIKYLIGVFKKHNLQKLEELCIEQYDRYEDRLGNVIVKNCPKLKQLALRNVNLSDDSLTNIHSLHDLENVDFKYTGLGNEGIKSLTRCARLKNLDFTCCHNLTETGLMLMVEFSNLHVLRLEDISVKGLPIDLFSSRLPHLQHLSVNYCNDVDREALARLKEEKPHLLVYDDEPFVYTDDEYEHDNDDDDYDDDAENGGENEPHQNEVEIAQPVPEVQGDGPNEVDVDQPVPDEHLLGNEVNEVAVGELVPEAHLQGDGHDPPEDQEVDNNIGAQVIEPIPEQDPEEDEEIDLLICIRNLFGITSDTEVLPEAYFQRDESNPEAAEQIDCHIGSEVIEPVSEQHPEEDEESDLLIYVRNLFEITSNKEVLPEAHLYRDESNLAQAQQIDNHIEAQVIEPLPEEDKEFDLLFCVQTLFGIDSEKEL